MNERITIIQFVERCCAKHASNTFLREKVNGEWTETTFAQTREQAHRVAAGLMSLGLGKGDKVALLSEGRNAWIIGELGILYAGGVNVPLSINLAEGTDLIFRIRHSDAKMVMVSKSQLPKIRRIIDELPAVEKIVVFDELEDFAANEISLREVLELGDAFLSAKRDEFVARYESIGPDDYANISYTSGTTADPKGILLTHRNYTANVEQATSVITVPSDYVMLIILPLDHCFAHVAGFYIMMHVGASIATVPFGKSPMEMLRNVPGTIKEVRPHIMLSVPAISKNFKKGIEAGIRKKSPFVQKLYNMGLSNAIKYNKEVYNRGGWQFWRKPLMALFDKLVFSAVRQSAFGGRMKFFVGGGALLDIDLQRYYYAIGVPIYQGYGLSEATPIICANSPVRYVMGSSGRLVQPMECKICDSEGREVAPGELGEIVVKGENVMAGYWKNPETTAKTVIDGWLHTGDMGYIWPEDKSILYVVGRFKALLISADGEKYSPELMEESYVESSRFIDGAILHNSQDPYTILLMVPNKDALKDYVKTAFPSLDPASEEAKIKMLEKLQEEVNIFRRGGSHAGQFPDRWLPAAVCVLPEAFSLANGQMNSTSKVVRRNVEKAYEDKMAYAYTPEGKNIVNPMNLSAL